ncbi:MAG TPA: DUF3386 domain-containing protein [Coleofasciculaceae cyanobacterium]
MTLAQDRAQEVNARDLFRAAYENRYTWDTNFPGYTADVELRQGDEVYRGSVAIAPDFTVSISGIDHPEVLKTLEHQLRDFVTHRQRGSFDKSHGENEFRLGETDETGAVEILVSGKSMGSSYKVRNQEICHVERPVGPMKFIIDTQETMDTGEGYLPILTDANFYKLPEGHLVKQVRYEDTHDRVGNYVLMSSQTIRVTEGDREIVTTMTFSNLKLHG